MNAEENKKRHLLWCFFYIFCLNRDSISSAAGTVTTSSATTTKAYITGTTAGGTGSLIYDPNVYLSTTSGRLYASTVQANRYYQGTTRYDLDAMSFRAASPVFNGGMVTDCVTTASNNSASLRSLDYSSLSSSFTNATAKALVTLTPVIKSTSSALGTSFYTKVDIGISVQLGTAVSISDGRVFCIALNGTSLATTNILYSLFGIITASVESIFNTTHSSPYSYYGAAGVSITPYRSTTAGYMPPMMAYIDTNSARRVLYVYMDSYFDASSTTLDGFYATITGYYNGTFSTFSGAYGS